MAKSSSSRQAALWRIPPSERMLLKRTVTARSDLRMPRRRAMIERNDAARGASPQNTVQGHGSARASHTGRSSNTGHGMHENLFGSAAHAHKHWLGAEERAVSG
jgi:hypothetical protein